MKLIRFCPMRKKRHSMMLFVNDDLQDDLRVDNEVLIFEIFEGLVEDRLILIFEIIRILRYKSPSGASPIPASHFHEYLI